MKKSIFLQYRVHGPLLFFLSVAREYQSPPGTTEKAGSTTFVMSQSGKMKTNQSIIQRTTLVAVLGIDHSIKGASLRNKYLTLIDPNS